MKTLFAKNYFTYAVIIVLSFVLLGSVFIYQIGRFAMQEKQTQLSETAARAVQTTEAFYGNRTGADWQERFNNVYLINMKQLAGDCDGVIFVGDAEGGLDFIATAVNCYTQENGVLPPLAVQSVLANGSYLEHSDFYGYLASSCYIKGARVELTKGTAAAVVFVAIPDASTEHLIRRLSTFFILFTLGVLVLTLVVTVFATRRTVRPLQQIAHAARAFGRGELSVRVPLPERQDETYALAVSFNSMANSLENIEMTRRGLIASVSHDLRTPMTTIAGFVDGILDGTIPPARQEHYLRIISDEVKRLGRLANTMLTVSRLEAGGELNRTVFDLSEMIRRIVISFEQRFSDKQIDVQLELPERLSISGDHDTIFQAVYNLADNAVKFVPPQGSIRMTLQEKNGYVQFSVSNTGEEIPPETLAHVFEQFYKGDPSRSSSGSRGSGLGLYIVKTVIHQHGGDVAASSAGGLSTFSFTLPVDAK